jgi:hypothetical protein
MREIRPSGSEGGARFIPCPYPIPDQLHKFHLVARAFWTAVVLYRFPRRAKRVIRNESVLVGHGAHGHTYPTAWRQCKSVKSED